MGYLHRPGRGLASSCLWALLSRIGVGRRAICIEFGLLPVDAAGPPLRLCGRQRGRQKTLGRKQLSHGWRNMDHQAGSRTGPRSGPMHRQFRDRATLNAALGGTAVIPMVVDAIVAVSIG